MEQRLWIVGFACAATFAGGLWLFALAFKRLALRRAVSDTPTSKVRSAALGRVELKGVARCLEKPFVAPFSGLSCVWWRIKVEEERRDSRGRISWVVLHEETLSPPFRLDDGSGQVLVQPHGAEMDVLESVRWMSGRLLQAPPPSGPQGFIWAGGPWARRRLFEWCVMDGLPVYALGVLREKRDEGSQDPVIVMMQGMHGEPFLISTRDEDGLLRSMLGSVLARLALGAALMVVALAFAAWHLLGWR